MKNVVWRTDLQEPTVLSFKVDDAMSRWIEDGLKHQAEELRATIQEHLDMCGPGATLCQVRIKKAVEVYGSFEEASRHNAAPFYNCLQDLAYLYTELGRISHILFQIHELRLDPTKHGTDPELTDWVPRDKLAEIKASVAYRTEQGALDTSLMPAIKDDEVDTAAPSSAGKRASILGLTDDLPDVSNTSYQPITEPHTPSTEEPQPEGSESVADDGAQVQPKPVDE